MHITLATLVAGDRLPADPKPRGERLLRELPLRTRCPEALDDLSCHRRLSAAAWSLGGCRVHAELLGACARLSQVVRT